CLNRLAVIESPAYPASGFLLTRSGFVVVQVGVESKQCLWIRRIGRQNLAAHCMSRIVIAVCIRTLREGHKSPLELGYVLRAVYHPNSHLRHGILARRERGHPLVPYDFVH